MSDAPFAALGRFVAALTFAQLPRDVVDRARLVVLDTLGAIIAGRRSPEMGALAAWARGEGASPAISMLVAASAGVVHELDEGHAAARGHPGIHVVPGALLEAARLRRSGAHCLSALVAGYEVAARLGAATTLRTTMHPHGTWGTCGCAAATAHLLALDAARAADALRIAASMQMATSYEVVRDGSPVRHLWAGMGNLTGAMAAHLAKAGLAAPVRAPAIVFGEIVGTAFDADQVERELGQTWAVTSGYFKRYACCRHGHAALDALHQALGPRRLAPDAIAAIHVRTYRSAVRAMTPDRYPARPLAAKFSLPYVVGAYLVRGDLDPAAFAQDALADARVAAIAARVKVSEDAAMTARVPASRGAAVDIELRDGTRLSGLVAHSHGDPLDPMHADEVEAKFMRLAAPVIGESDADRLRHLARKIEELPDVGELADGLRMTPA